MATRLTFADLPQFADDNSVELSIELSSDLYSHRSFWTLVLLMVTIDNASELMYQLDAEDDCLAAEIEGTNYPLMPPPSEYRQELLKAARRLASGNRIRCAVARLWKSYPVGSIAIETAQGDVVWQVFNLSNGVRMVRTTSAARL